MSSISERGSPRPPVPLRTTNAVGDGTTTGRKANPILSLGGMNEPVPVALSWAFDRQIRRMRQSVEGPLPFPLGCFPVGMAEFVRQAAKSRSCPPDYIAAPMLAVVGAFIGRSRPLKVKEDWSEVPNLFLAVVGETGSSKSPALNLVMKPAWDRDNRLAADQARFEKSVGDAAKKVKDKTPVSPPPVQGQFVCCDVTVEALGELLNKSPRGLLCYRDELTALARSFNQYRAGKGSDREFYLSLWSSTNTTINRTGKPLLRVRDPYLSIVGCITPDMLGELGDARGREDGFVDRFLLAYPAPVQDDWIDDPPDPSLVTQYGDLCERIVDLPAAHLRFSPPAQEIFAAWYRQHSRESDGPAGPRAKMKGYCARLANILHHLRHASGEAAQRDVIDRQSVEGAISLIDYFNRNASRIFTRVRESKEESKLIRLFGLVRKSEKFRVTNRAVIRANIARDADEAEGLLKQLANWGLGTLVAGDRSDSRQTFEGRPDAFRPGGIA